MQRGRSKLGRFALSAFAIVAVSTVVDFAFTESEPALAAYCGDATDTYCGFGLPSSPPQQPYCYVTEVPIKFTLTSQSTAPQTSSAYVSGTYTYPGGGTGTWRMNIGGPIATTTNGPYHTGASWGLNNAGNPFAIFDGDLGRTNLALTPTASPAAAELVQFRPNADADYLNGARNTFANHTNHWTFDRTFAEYRLEDPDNQTTRTTGIYRDTALLYQRTTLDNRLSTYVVTGDTASLWVQDHGGSAYEGWSQSAIAKYTTCLTVTQTGTYVDTNNNGYPDPGDHVKFTYVLTNPGTATLSGLNVADSGVTMNNSNVTVAGGSSVTVTGTYPLTAADILNGTVTRNGTASGVDVVGNSVSDIADSPTVTTNIDSEGDGEPDDPTTVVLPPPPADLAVTKTDDVDPLREGDTVTYTISVVNNGPGTIDPGDTFIVYDEIPTGLVDPQFAAPDPAQWNPATGEITGVKLAPGESIELTVSAIAATTGTTVENRVTVKSPIGDPEPGNDVAVETTTILPKADLKITKSAVPSPVVAGTAIAWTITVANGGPNDASNVIVTDAIPAEVTSPTVTGCSYSGNSCNLGTVAAGASKTITVSAIVSEDTPAGTEIDNSASVTSDTEDPDQTNNSATAKTPVEAESDVVLVKSSSPNPYVPGDPITYTFTIYNSGPSTANGVVLKDSFPAGLSGMSADDPNCTLSGPDMTCEIGTLGVGDTVTVTVTADTDPGLVDPVVNSAFVDVGTNDPNLDNNLSVDNNGAKPLADLRVVKSDLADPVLAGDSIAYTVSVTNQGPSVATGVELVDDFGPAGVGLALAGVPTVTAGNGSCDTTGCTFAEIAVGETAVVTYNIAVPDDVATGTTVTNTAKIGSAVGDPDDANNVADETTTIETQADLSITKVGADAPVAGQNFTYTLTVANAGPSVSGSTVITDELPPGATFVPTGSSPTCTVSGSTVSCDVASLGSGDQTEVAIEVAVDPAYVGTLANTATVAPGSNAPDPDTSNNSATHTGVASAEADLAVSKSVNKTSAAAGTSLEWTLVVTNNGPSTATGVSVDDVIPAGVTVSSVSSTIAAATCTEVSSCALGDLAPGDVATITITGDIDPAVADGSELVNQVSVTTAADDPNPSNNDAEVSTVVASVADLSLVKTASPNPYTPGSQLTFTVSATNLGPSQAVGASFVDDLPPNFGYTGYTVSSGSGSCNLSGATLTCAADPMAPGTAFTVVIQGDTNPGAITAMSNTASMVTPTAYTDPEGLNDASTVNVGSTPNADLGISKTPVGSVTTPGAAKQWTVTVTNAGPTDATGVVVTDTLPAGAVFVAATPSSGSGSCTHDGAATGGVITCDLGALPANGIISIVVDTMLESSIAEGAQLTNTAEVTSDTDDADADNNTADATVTASRIADVAITKVDDPDPVVAGQAVTWTIVVANAGPSDAGAVVVTDSIPAGFSIDSVSPSGCDVTGNDVSCSLGTVAPGTPVEVVIVAKASSTYVADGLVNPVTNIVGVASPDDDNTANDQAQTSTLVVERSDVSVAKSAPAELRVGDPVTWTIDVTNSGPSVAENVTVSDPIPPGIVVEPADVTGPGCSLAGNDVTCSIGSLAAGSSTQIVVTGSIPANYLSSGNAATLSNSASISSSSTDTDIGNNQASADTVITEQADLNIAKVAQSSEVAAGQQITWTIEVLNNGPADARAVEVADSLPTGVMVVSASTDNGGSCDGAGTCLLGTVGADQLVTITVVGEVAADQAAGPITNTASVTSLSPDPDLSNNTADAAANVVVSADLVVSKTGPSAAVPGQPISYTVTVFNDGPSDATGVTVTDTLPGGLLNASASTDVGACTAADLCDIGTLAAGSTATVTIDATVDPNLTATELTNIVNALPDSSTSEPNPDNNDASTTAAVTPVADVTLAKVGDVNPVIAGTNLVWTLTATNAGPSAARDVVIADTLPPGVQLVSAPECAGTTALECSIADLAAGDSYSVTVEVRVDSSYYDDGHTTPLTNTATITTATPELDTTNNTAVETTTVADLAGVAIGKSHEGFTVTAGETSTWLLTVVNTGPSSAQNVVVTDAIPAGTTFVSATASNGATCTEDAGTLTCELGTIGLDELVDIVVELDVSPDFLSSGPGSPISNTASATSTTDDPNPADNVGVDTLDVVDAADLAVTKTGPAEANAGDQIQWDVTVVNNGPSVARAVVIDDPAPAGVVIESTSPSGLCDDFVTCQLGDLAPGESASVSIVARIDSTWLVDAYPQPLSNAASAASESTADPVAENDVAYADTIINEAAALTVTKTDSPDPVIAGEEVTWVVSVTNAGPSLARAVTVDDPVPTGVSVIAATSSTGDGCTFDVTCTLASVAVGATETVTIVGLVDPSIAASTNAIENLATVTSPTIDGDRLTADSITAVEEHANLSIAKTDGGTTVTAGETVNWAIAVTNDGPSDAANTIVTDTLPNGLDLGSIAVAVTPSSAGTCDLSALPGVTCDLGTLAAGSTASISVAATVQSTYLADGNPNPMANTAEVGSDAVETDPTDNTSTELTPIDVAADLTIAKSGPATISAGEQLTWTIDVGNLGPSAASGLMINDAIPTGIVVESASPGCAIDGQYISCELAQLAVGSTHTVTVVGAVPADYVASGQPSDVTNGAAVTSNVVDPDPTNNSSRVPTTVAASVDLSVTKSVAPSEVAAGDAATWTVTVTNAGPSVATDVVVADALPDGFTPISTEADNGGVCDAAATCRLGSIAPQESVVISINGTVDAAFVSSGGASPIVNTASVTAHEGDTDPSNNAATAVLDVASTADLEIVKIGSDTLVPGTTTDYTITVTNRGPSDAVAATVTDLLPAELTDVTMTPSQGTCTAGDCELGNVPADSTATISVVGTVDPNATSASITNTASVASATDDPDATNNEASITATVAASADVEIAKTESVDPVIAGQPLTWTLEATNNGPSTARDVVIADELPAGVTLVEAAGCDGTTTLACSAGDIAVGETVAFTVDVIVNADYYTAGNASPISNTATHSATTPDSNALNDSHTELTTVAALAGVAVGKSSDTANTSAGSPIEWTITVINSGPSDADNVVVTDPIPAGLTVESATFDGRPCTIGTDIVCNVGVIPVDGVVAISVLSTVDQAYVVDAQPNPLINLATATSDTEDPELADNTGGDQVNIVAADDVSITKTAPATATAGGPIEWTVSVTNAGPSIATDVVITDPINDGITGVAADIEPATAGSCDATVSCTLDTLAPGETVVVTITGTVAPTWIVDDRGTSLVNTASVTSSADTDATNNTSSAATTIEDQAALTINKTATPGPVNAGGELRWTVEVTNDGPSAADQVVVADTVPDNIVVTSVESTVGTCTFAVTCELGSLDVGQTATLTIVGSVPASWFTDGGPATVTNIATAVTPTNPDQTIEANAISDIVATADVSVVKTDVADPVVAGQTVRWVLTASNAGPSDATGTVIRDTLPDGLDLSTVTVSPDSANCDTADLPLIVCNPGVLAAGTSVAIDVTAALSPTYLSEGLDNPMQNGAVISADPTITDPNPDNNSDIETTEVVPLADVSVVKSVEPVTVNAGEDVTFTMVVTNAGPSTATGVALSDAIPAGIAIISAATDAPGSDPCPVSGQSVMCTIGTLAVGDQATVTVVGTVDPAYVADAAPNPIVNSARVTATTPDPVGTNDSDSADLAVVDLADLSVTKSPSAADAVAGTALGWSITVTNAGPSVSRAVDLTDLVPDGYRVNSIAADNGGACDNASCALGDLGVGQSVVVQIAGTVDPAFAGAALSNTASVSGPTADPNGDNDAATATANISSDANLAVTKTGPPEFTPGEEVAYRIVVDNLGPSTATEVTLADEFPSGLNVDNVVPSKGTCAAIAVCDLGTLAPGDQVTVDVTGTVDPAATDDLVNTAYASATQPDSDTENNSDSVVSTPLAVADVRIAKDDVTDLVLAGDQLSWTLTATNDGPSVARSVTISDSLPAGTTLVSTSSTCEDPTDLTCAVGDLYPGQSITVTVVAAVDPDYYAAGNANPLLNHAEVTSATDDPNLGNNGSSDTTTIAANAGLSIAKDADVARIDAGERVAWTLTVYNAGPSTGEAVVVSDALPAGVVFASAQASNGAACSATANTLTCELGNVAVGTTVTIVVAADLAPDYVSAGLPQPLLNTATVSSITEDPFLGDNAAVDQVAVTDAADLHLSKTAPGTVDAGRTVTWSIAVANDGPSVARSVTLEDLAPPGVTITGATSSAAVANCTTTAVCELGDLNPGQETTINLTGKVDSTWFVDGRGTTLTNTASVDSETRDDAPADNTGSATTIVGESAQLVATKVATSEAAIAGRPVTWKIEVTNNGPSAARDVTIDDPAPTGTTITSVNPIGSCSFAASCTVDVLAVGATTTVEVQTTVDAAWISEGRGDTLTNAATITTATNGADTVVVEGQVPVDDLADLSVTKAADLALVSAGESIRWTIAAHNDGPSTALAATVTDTLPAGVSLDNINPPTGVTCDTDSLPTITCDLGDLPSGATVDIQLGTTVDASYFADGGVGPITNQVEVDSATSDPTPSDRTASVATQVANDAGVAIGKRATAPETTAGQTVSWIVEVANAGPGFATAVTVSDPIPTGVTVTSADVLASVGTCTVEAEVVCTLGDLAPGTTALISITGTVTDRYLIDHGTALANTATVATTSADDPADNEATASVGVIDRADLNIVKTASVPGTSDEGGPAVAGGPIVWDIAVVNSGPSTARTVDITDRIPDGVTVISVDAPGATCEIGATVTCSLDELAPADPASPAPVVVTVTGTIDPAYLSAGGVDFKSIVNTAAVSAATPDPSPASASVTTPVVDSANVVVTKTAAGDVVAGESMTWNVTVTNTGVSDARDVVLTDRAPNGVTFTDVTASTGRCTLEAVCELGTIPAGDAVEVVLVGVVDADVGAGSTIANTASIVSATPDPVIDPDPVVETPVSTSADLAVTKRDASDPVIAGTTVYWTLDLRNFGPSTATNVSVSDTVPAGVTVSSITGDGAAGCGLDGVCVFDSVEVGGTRTITVVGIVADDYLSGDGPNPLINTAAATSAEPDPNPADNATEHDTTIVGNAGLSISKTVDRVEATAGSPLRWTISATNAGPSIATDVVVSDVIPSGVTVDTIGAPAGSRCADLARCELGDLGVGETIAITVDATVDPDAVIEGVETLENRASVAGATIDPDTSDNEAAATSGVAASADLSLIKAAAADTAAGGVLTWTLTVSNAGPSTADAITITDQLPEGLTLTTVTSTDDAATCSDEIVCTVDRLGPGDTVVITVTTATPVDASTVEFNNSASVSSPTPDPDVSNNGGQATATAFGAQIGLAKRVVGTPTMSSSGSFTVTYELRVVNTGASRLSGLQVTDDLAARLSDATSFEVVSAASSDFTINPDFDGVRDLNLLAGTDLLSVGDSGTIRLQVEIVPNTIPSTFANYATASGSPASGVRVSDRSVDGTTVDPDGDGDPSDNTGSTLAALDWKASIGAAKELAQPVVAEGDGSFTVVFDIDVRNFGDVDLTDVQITDDLTAAFAGASSFEVVAVTSDDLTVNPSFDGRGDTNLLSGADDLPVGAGGTVLLTTSVVPTGAGQRFSNSAAVIAIDPSGTVLDDLSQVGSFGCDGDQSCRDDPGVLVPSADGNDPTDVPIPTTGLNPRPIIAAAAGLTLTGGALLTAARRRRRDKRFAVAAAPVGAAPFAPPSTGYASESPTLGDVEPRRDG